MKFTIEEVLEMSIKHVQDTCRDEEQHNQAQANLLSVCAGIVAGIKSIKQEEQE